MSDNKIYKINFLKIIIVGLKKKIFIEIGIPDKTKLCLKQKIEQWKNLPIKWTKEGNLHITISFIGYVDESVVPDICLKVKKAVKKIEVFELFFDKIGIGPDESNPKMIWLSGKPSPELKELKNTIEKALEMHPQCHKKYKPHITLGRIRKMRWNDMSEKPKINEKTNFSISVNSVSVMESRSGESEYIILEKCELS